MNPSRPFILRPVGTALLMAAIMLVGLVALRFLPLSALPAVDYPTIHLPELFLERCGDRRGHYVRRRTRIERLHLDGRIVDGGQRGQRQEAQRDEADQHDCRHQQRRADRTQNKRTRWIHAGAVRLWIMGTSLLLLFAMVAAMRARSSRCRRRRSGSGST